MDACHSTSTHDHQQPTDAAPVEALSNKLGHNGPYFGAADPIAQDCDKLAGHGDLFRSLEAFEADLRTAAERIGHAAEVANQASIVLTDTGVDDNGTVAQVAGHLHLAALYMANAQLMAEVLEDREGQRLRDREARTFHDMVKGQPRAEMSWYERLKAEAVINWRIGKLLDRLSEVCGIDRSKAWPFIDTARMEEISKLVEGPSADQIKAMDGEALLYALHQLEAKAADTRKRIALIHALRHVQSA